MREPFAHKPLQLPRCASFARAAAFAVDEGIMSVRILYPVRVLLLVCHYSRSTIEDDDPGLSSFVMEHDKT